MNHPLVVAWRRLVEQKKSVLGDEEEVRALVACADQLDTWWKVELGKRKLERLKAAKGFIIKRRQKQR